MVLPSRTEVDFIYPGGRIGSVVGQGILYFVHDGAGIVVLDRDIINPEYWDGVMIKN